MIINALKIKIYFPGKALRYSAYHNKITVIIREVHGR